MLVWAASFGLARAEMLPALFDVTGVAANDVLNLRDGPNAGAEKRGELAPDTRRVEVTVLSPDGKWGLVAQPEVSAWAAMRFLARVPGPDWDALQTPISCYGTEPFWSLSMNAAHGQMVLERVEGADIPLSAEWSAPTAGQHGVVGMAVSGAEHTGFLTLSGQSCSDGMSDRSFGIALMIFLRDDNGVATGYSGCCALSR